MAFNHDADTAVSAVSAVSAELLNWSVLWSPLLSSPQSKEKKIQKWHSQEFWLMLTSLQPSPPAKVGRRLITEGHSQLTYQHILP